MQGRHTDNDLDKAHRSRWRLVLLWFMIALATVVLIMVARGMIDKVQNIGADSSPRPADSPFVAGDPTDIPEPIISTIRVPVPGPTIDREVAGPRTTVTKTMPSPVPGPTVTIRVTESGPTVTSKVPGPRQTVYQKADPAPTVTVTETETRCYLLKRLAMIEVPCP